MRERHTDHRAEAGGGPALHTYTNTACTEHVLRFGLQRSPAVGCGATGRRARVGRRAALAPFAQCNVRCTQYHRRQASVFLHILVQLWVGTYIHTYIQNNHSPNDHSKHPGLRMTG